LGYNLATRSAFTSMCCEPTCGVVYDCMNVNRLRVCVIVMILDCPRGSSDPGSTLEPCLCTVSAVCVPPREHENEASVNVCELLPFTYLRLRFTRCWCVAESGMNDVVYGLLGVLCILNPWISPHSLIIGCFSALRLRVSHFEGPSRHLAPAVNAVYVLELLAVCICWCRAPHSACTISRSP